MKIGIDFGTTYTKLAYLDFAGTLRAFEYPPGDASSRYVPSAAAYRRGAGGLELVAIGQAARRLALDEDDVVLFQNFKMLLPVDASRWAEHGWPSEEKSPADVTGDFLERLILTDEGAFCREAGGRHIESLVLSVPEVWQRTVGNPGAERLQSIVAERLGLPLSHLQSEPVCAAAALTHEMIRARRPIEGTLLICDVGGGTFDVALCEMSGSKISVLDFDGNGHEGIGTSGVMFDRNAAKLAYQSATGAEPDPADPDFLMLVQELEQTKIHNASAASRMIELSRTAPLANEPLFRVKRRYKLTVGQFHAVFAPIKAGIADVLERICNRARQRGRSIDNVMVVGGFGQFRPVRAAIFEALGDDAPGPDETTARDTERDHLAIAHGAALVANGMIQTEERYPHTIGVLAARLRDGRLEEGFPYPIIEAGKVPIGDQGSLRTFAESSGQKLAFEIRGTGRRALPVVARALGEGEWLELKVPSQDLPPPGLYHIGVEVDRSQIASLIFRPASGAGADHRYLIGRYPLDILVHEGRRQS